MKIKSFKAIFKQYDTRRIFILVVFVVIGFFYYFLLSAPPDFPKDSIVNIKKGKVLKEISFSLKQEKLVRSSVLFQFFVITFGGDRLVLAGDYVFERRIPVFWVALRLATGDYRVSPIKVTIREGLTLVEIANVLNQELPIFNKEEFLRLTQDKEGYLFPDTYLFFPSIEIAQIIEKMMNNFDKQLASLESDIAKSGRSLDEIIKMASLIEKESHNSEERRVISGILWKRLEQDMLLQVDATFLYINGKASHELSIEDLHINSPYNTYVYKGLPPTPICNPGLDAIWAAINPLSSEYLFYLHGKKGNIHYAVNFEGHKENKKKYLR